jgi:hypothetical protein
LAEDNPIKSLDASADGELSIDIPRRKKSVEIPVTEPLSNGNGVINGLALNLKVRNPFHVSSRDLANKYIKRTLGSDGEGPASKIRKIKDSTSKDDAMIIVDDGDGAILIDDD